MVAGPCAAPRTSNGLKRVTRAQRRSFLSAPPAHHRSRALAGAWPALVSLGDLSPLRPNATLQRCHRTVEFTVPERSIALRQGQDVTFQVAALPGRTFKGRATLSIRVTLPARAITIKAVTANADGVRKRDFVRHDGHRRAGRSYDHS